MQFSAPIIIAMILGWFFPYQAYLLSIGAFIPLFLLSFFSGLLVDIKKIKQFKTQIKPIGLTLIISFLIIPAIQYILAKIFLSNYILIYGVLVAALSPVAIVAPMFTQLHKGDTELSLSLFFISTCLFPVILLFALTISSFNQWHFDLIPIIKFASIISIFPLIFSLLFLKFFKKLSLFLKKQVPWINSLLLSIVIFSLFGNINHKINTNYLEYSELIFLMAIMIIPDFGVYIFSQKILTKYFTPFTKHTISINISMKNLALSAGILLTHAPLASLPIAMGFVVHSLFFGYLFFLKK